MIDKAFADRLQNGQDTADKGRVGMLPYLTPLEVLEAREWTKTRKLPVYFWGGYEGAERKCLFFLPDYYVGCEPAEVLTEEIENAVCPVTVKGSGFVNLGHRDYLGAILQLGLKREALGDICIQNAHTAVLFCTKIIAEFLKENLKTVGKDTVKVIPEALKEEFTDGRKYQPMSLSVASLRLDGVVAGLTHLSREESAEAVVRGDVTVNYRVLDRVDKEIPVPATLSVRGYGRYELRRCDGETKKGRLKLFAEKCI